MRNRLLIATTVPETLHIILRNQPRFINSKFDVYLVTSPGRTVNKIARAEGVPVYTLKMKRNISVINDLVSVLYMVKLIVSLKPDIVHSYTPKAGLITMLAAWLCRVPVRIHTFTGLIFPYKQGLFQKVVIIADRLLCLCATDIVPEGEGIKTDLIKYNITDKPLSVIGYGNISGIDLDFFSTDGVGVIDSVKHLRHILNVSSNTFAFCYIGRLNSDKGIAELISAFKQLSTEAIMIIAGGVDDNNPVSSYLMDEIKHHARLHWIGFQDDVRPVLSLSNVLILPSYREGFPNVLLEAGAMKTPAIVTDISGCNEVIQHGSNGWVVPVGNINLLASSMRDAMNLSPGKLNNMGVIALRNVRKKYSQAEHYKRLIKFYHESLNGNHIT